jgi:hypothetical protein
MNVVSAAADMQAEFQSLLSETVRRHGKELTIRINGDKALAMAKIDSGEEILAEWPASRCEAFLTAVFGLCDQADPYTYGSSRSLFMTGEKATLPVELRTVLVQFMPFKDGGRHLVARLTYQGDMCCGTCGG